MAHYYVGRKAQDDGNHEVHQTGCPLMPTETKRLYLGAFDSCVPAVEEATKTYPRSTGCYRCSNDCSTNIGAEGEFS